MKNYSIIILLFILLNSCNRNREIAATNMDVIQVNVNKTTSLTYNDSFSSTTLIPLETIEESLIFDIDKLYFTENHIIIFDQKAMNILLFGIDGHFIRKIGNKGNAPDEYTFLNDIQFNKKDTLIYAHDRFQNRIYKYNLAGQLVDKTSKSNIFFNSFYKTDEGYWVYSCFAEKNPKKYNLMLLDENLDKVKKMFFPQNNFVNASFLSTFMSNEEDRLFFIYPSSNIVYELQHEDVIPFVQIDFGDKTMPYNQIIKLQNMDDYDKLLADKQYLGNISDFRITKNAFYFSFRETGFNVAVSSYSGCWNFSTKKISVYNNPFIESATYPISTHLLYASDTMLVYPIHPMVLTENSFPLLSENLSTDIKSDSNPILAVLKIKQ